MRSIAQGFLSFAASLLTPSLRKPPQPSKSKPLVAKEPKYNHYENVTLTKAMLNSEEMYDCQLSALLLSRLPVEIRNLIWIHVLGNNTIHFFCKGSQEEKLCAYVCGKQKEWTCESVAHGGKRLKELTEQEMNAMPALGCMGALTSCRALYFETTEILYSRNTFDFSDCWSSIEHLPWLLPLSSLSQLSTITVTIVDLYSFTNCINFYAWRSLWSTLGLLRGLKELKIGIAIKEKLEKATIKKADLMKIEQELLSHLKALEDIPGRRKAKWEIIFPCESEEGESEAARELMRNGWKITRI